MRKTARFVIFALIILIAVFVIWKGRGSAPDTNDFAIGSSTPVAVSETNKVSSTVSEYQNSELGFSVKYPNIWQKEENNSGVTFVIPIDSTQTSTISTLQISVQVVSGTCAFPPVTTVKDRTTLKVGELSFDTISMSNSVQGRTYFDRMYSLQKQDICYMFRLASITLSPARKGLKGSNVTQAENNNKAIINSADAAFTTMVKSFSIVTGPQGEDETKAAPVK